MKSSQAAQLREGRLATVGHEIMSAMSDAALGPLIVAPKIVKLADEWENWRTEAEGLTCSQWLIRLTGNDKHNDAYFRRRAEAVRRIGEHARRVWHHEAAIWACGHLADDVSLKRLSKEVNEVSRKRGGQPQCKSTVITIARRLGLVRPRKAEKASECTRCNELEKLLEENGIEVPE